MKKLYFLFLLFVSGAMMAQIPQGFSYQAMALNASGNPVASSPVKIRLSILENSAAGTAVYVETHNPTTNAQGLFTLVIGQGQATTGTFSGINWGTNSKFLKVEIDVNNGTNYVTVGSSQLLAVPYAMYAGAVVGMGGSTGTQFNDLYVYGTFNSYNAATALQLAPLGTSGFSVGYKYFTAGTQIKFIPALNSSIAYGNGGNGALVPNGAAWTINSTGFYELKLNNFEQPFMEVNSMAVTIQTMYNSNGTPMTYNASTGKLSATVNVPSGTDADSRKFYFSIGGQGNSYGDNMANGQIDYNGTPISLPGTGNYKIELTLNFTGEGSPYTITAI